MCRNCHNTQDHKDLVTQTIAYTRSRNPASFEAKVTPSLPERLIWRTWTAERHSLHGAAHILCLDSAGVGM